MKRLLSTLSIISLLSLGVSVSLPISTLAITSADPSTGNSQAPNTDSSSSDPSGAGGDVTTGDPEANKPNVDPATSINGDCDSKHCDIISNYVNPFIKLLTVVVGLAVAIGVIFGSIEVTTSGGDPQRAASGKNHIRNAMIAIVGYIFLFAILNFLLPGGIL